MMFRQPLARRLTSVHLLCALLVVPTVAKAQDAAQPAPAATQEAASPGAPSGPGEQAVAAEEQTKPTRAFFPTLFHNLGQDIKKIPRRNTLYWLAGGTALALVAHPQDNTLNRRLRGSDGAEIFFKAGKYVGSMPVLLAASVGTYVVGRTHENGRVRHLGMDLIEATVLSQVINQGIKEIVRRKRPLREDGTRSKGFAFPSGHSSATFAAATVLQQHLGWKAAVPTYSIAAYVAISRMHDERHFASDVVFGAAEGIIIGRSVTWHGRNFYASPLLLPKGAGIVVSVNTERRRRAS